MMQRPDPNLIAPPSTDPRDFNTAMAHLYRGEIGRATAWRSRLDVTTNWSLAATGAAVTFAFGQSNAHHSVILLDFLLVTLFLFIEARGYRFFELWSYRVRLLETHYYGAMLSSTVQPAPDWKDRLAQSLMQPRFSVSIWEALGRRLRRTYAWIYIVLELAWVAKLLLTMGTNISASAFVRQAHMGAIPGWAVLLLVLLFNVVLLGVSVYSLRLHEATGEVLPYRHASPPEPEIR
jgi:uncharacterized membrane protein